MKAAVLTAPNKIEFIERPVPEPGPGEVQIKMHTAAICGTDVHISQGFPIGAFQPRLPLVLGHEASATVTAVGSGVKYIREGQRCVVEANIGCGTCDICRKGSYCLCENVKVISIHADGIFAEYAVLPECAVHPIPDSYDWEPASLTEPLAMTMLTFFDCPVTPGDYVAVLGAGKVDMAWRRLPVWRGRRR
jgi:L-iditol 2-dehydrogenase